MVNDLARDNSADHFNLDLCAKRYAIPKQSVNQISSPNLVISVAARGE
jgi:hypothetical protein